MATHTDTIAQTRNKVKAKKNQRSLRCIETGFQTHDQPEGEQSEHTTRCTYGDSPAKRKDADSRDNNRKNENAEDGAPSVIRG